MGKQQLVEQLERILHLFPPVRLAYLFGSRVEGQVGPLSDIDLGILLESEVDPDQTGTRLAQRLGHALGERSAIDLVVMNQAPVELAYAIFAQGECVFQRDLVTRVEHEADVLSRYGDYLPVIRAQRAEILRGGEHGHRVQRYREARRRTERTFSQIRSAQR